VLVSLPFHAEAADQRDAYLSKIQAAFELKPLEPAKRLHSPKFELGRMLFFDPIISGNREIACGSCHFPQAAGADGLPIAVGIGARGIGTERLRSHAGMAQRRNALAFWGVGDPQVTHLFWDGRVQELPDGKIFTPIGVFNKSEVGSLLGAAALLPVVEADEMTGFVGDQSLSWIDASHKNLPNELAIEGESREPARAWQIHRALVRRVLGVGTASRAPWQEEYRKLFSDAYAGRSPDSADYRDLAAALGAFIGEAFVVEPAPWDRYLAGDRRAISDAAKDGAIIFFGKGKCAVCHSGELFSDFRFHALAVPQIGRGLEAGGIDPGRAGVTRQPDDKYAFRTPVLRNVLLTAPYTHSGYFSRLEDVIAHHANPIPALYRAQQREPEGAERQARLVAYLAPELRDSEPINSADIDKLVAFLSTLTSANEVDLMALVPNGVPSGLNHVVMDIRNVKRATVGRN
jgi:cytochrome c peroxidase